jgi:Common central domain of tyrosinase/Polyphenol oxidase middle domain
MTSVRRNIWNLGTANNPWDPVTLAYAHGVRAMQALPITDPRSWRYQAAIHGTYTPPPRGALWNQCQHATWYFLPWHRMYLFQFEAIMRSLLPAAEQEDFALPYWDYSSGAPSNALPVAFRVPTLPDNTPNPLFVSQRAPAANAGVSLPVQVTSTTQALAERFFTVSQLGASTGFGGPRTGFAHQGPAFGGLENRPHNVVHVAVGGGAGLMTDPNTAALDPIFWLHHCNIDRLWEVWRLNTQVIHANPFLLTWRNRSFTLHDENQARVSQRCREVVDIVGQLDYTYDSLPLVAGGAADADAAEEERRGSVPRRPQPLLIGSNDQPLTVGVTGAETTMTVTPPPERLAAGADDTRTYLNLTDIEGTKNPGVVYGVYVNLPAGTSPEDAEEYCAGVVAFFGIENTDPTTRAATRDAPHGMRFSFDITEIVDRLRAEGAWSADAVQVSLLPVTPPEEPGLAAAETPTVTIGTVAVYQG